MKLGKKVKWILMFIVSFLVYHLISCSFFPVNEENVLQAPDWYPILGIAIAAVVTYLLCRRPHKKRTSKAVESAVVKREFGDLAEVKKPRFKETQTASKATAPWPSLSNLSEFAPATVCTVLNDAKLLGTDLVIMSSHGASCSECAKYQGRVFSLSGNSLPFPKIPEAFFKYGGIHEGCGHTFSPYIHGVTDPMLGYTLSFQKAVSPKYRNNIIAFSNRPFVDDRFAASGSAKPTPQIDIQQIIKDEQEWRREQQGLPPVEYELQRIDGMEGHKFEYWCAELLKRNGFSSVEVTPGSNDQGVDITATKDGVRYAIQCKCYSSDLGNTPIQEVHAGKAIYHCQVGVVMTNRYFTASAKQAAEATGTLLWNRDKLIEMLEKGA